MGGCSLTAMRLEDPTFREALAAAIPPSLAPLVMSSGSGERVATADLLNEAMLAQTLGVGARDRRAVISIWALEAFETVLPTVMAAAVLLGRVPAIEMSWMIGDRGVTGLRSTWDEGDFAKFTLDVLAPFIALIAARGGVSPRVLWSNAGHIVEAFLGMLEREIGVSEETAEIRGLLAQPDIAGVPNGLFTPVRYNGERRIRRVCCLRFLVPSWRICLICPLPAGHASRDRG